MIPSSALEQRLPIADEWDVSVARQRVRDLAEQSGLSPPDIDAVTIAVSEVTHNIVRHAGRGELILARTLAPRGISVVARDEGPGIADIARAMQSGFSTAGGLGLGLPSARDLVDEFAIESTWGRGTTVTLKKWIRV